MDINEIKNYLENKFHIKFIVKDDDDSYLIKLFDSNNDFFYVRFLIKNDIRLTIVAEPEKYGKVFLKNINSSGFEKRKTFCQYWHYLQSKYLTLKINGLQFSEEAFIKDNSVWETFFIRYSVAPFFDEGHDRIVCICEALSNIIAMMFSLLEYEIEGLEEGGQSAITQNHYERNPLNRQLCLLAKGYKCCVCGFDFKKTYGKIGENFIEVHHSVPVSKMGANYVVDPISELFPLCSNCHSMVHRHDPPISVDELTEIIKNNKMH